MKSTAGSLDLGFVFGTASGTPYTFGGAAATSPGTGIGQINSIPYVVNPGYETPVSRVEYYFFPRDQYRTETQYRTDLAINYDHKLRGGASVFWHGEVVNLFNQFQLCGCGGSAAFALGGNVQNQTVDTAVRTNVTNPTLYQPFNPFTTTPIEGVNWAKSPTFGKALNRFAYTTPRTFRLAFGVRF